MSFAIAAEPAILRESYERISRLESVPRRDEVTESSPALAEL